MLIPTVPAKEFEKFGFKKCKGMQKDTECYYLCVARGSKMLFVSNIYFGVNDWIKDDPRIHKNANCRYSDKRDYLDIVYELIKEGMLKSSFEKGVKSMKNDEYNLSHIYDEVTRLHMTYKPDWRIGQFWNVFRTWLDGYKHINIHYLEDNELLEYLKEMCGEKSVNG